MQGVRSFARRRKAENPMGVGTPVRKIDGHQAIENTIQSHPIHARRTEQGLDFVMRQWLGRSAQHVQNTKPRRRHTQAVPPDKAGNEAVVGKMGRSQKTVPLRNENAD